MKFGYVRVSTKTQNLGRQLELMREKGVPEKNIYLDQASGKNFDRDGYRQLIDHLRAGDEIYVDSLDRLGRNYDMIISNWKMITKDLECDIIVSDYETLFNSKRFREMGDIGKLLEDQMLALFSYIAEQRRNEILRTQKQGIENAKANGKHLGRPSGIKDPKIFQAEIDKWSAGEITAVEVIKNSGCSKTYFYNYIKTNNIKKINKSVMK